MPTLSPCRSEATPSSETCISTCRPVPYPKTALRLVSRWPRPSFSVLAGQRVRHDIAMTGEITLSGRVLPIGGVREKILGAERAGIRRIVLPAENLPDLEELPQDVKERLEIHGVDSLGEVLALALSGAGLEDGRLHFSLPDTASHQAARLQEH